MELAQGRTWNLREAAAAGGLYRGLGATLLRDVPGVGAYYAAFEAMRRRAVALRGSPKLELAELAVAGNRMERPAERARMQIERAHVARGSPFGLANLRPEDDQVFVDRAGGLRGDVGRREAVSETFTQVDPPTRSEGFDWLAGHRVELPEVLTGRGEDPSSLS